MEPAEVSRALLATTSMASELGLVVDDAIVVQNSTRLSLRLVPCDVFARVAVAAGQNEEVAAFEIELARQVADVDGPVAELEPRVQPVVYVRDGFAFTYWRYYEPSPAGDMKPTEYAQSLVDLHAGLRQLDLVAQHFTTRIDEAQAIVGDRSQSPDLAEADRELLTNALHTLRRSIVDAGADEQLLHGEPHPGNLLKTASGMRFIDLETCCYGPVEVDVAYAPDEVGGHYPDIDQVLLRDCRTLTLAMVAAWRADRDDEFPNGSEMLDELLGRIREALG